ncbi:anti-sigma factor [Sphingomonas naphthae]|uniref:Anti-sigma factor n=1 Tax=Sphingomonas naphthae TaxID=1813468 RepID=A0ABY7TM92_9SPHN|nr:anti-sigma factor [Sphingomonas naphthae]WCT74070.1 anti-sigma factor [Sphingomonas naphthae]
MADDPDIDLTAGEYVLGTLDVAERRAFARRLMADPAAVEAVRQWQLRLAPIDLACDPVAPPATLWPRIDRATGGVAPANDNGVTRWRVATIAAALVAVVASGVALNGLNQPPPPAAKAGPGAVAALTADGAAPALMVTYDPAGKALRVIPISLSDRPGHSLQLWLIAPGAKPKPMTVMPPGGQTALKGIAIDPATETLFAISVEPIGGSPTGQPTGPVIYSGKLLDVPGA